MSITAILFIFLSIAVFYHPKAATTNNNNGGQYSVIPVSAQSTGTSLEVQAPSGEDSPATGTMNLAPAKWSDPWLNGFGYRKPISISNTGALLTDFQVNVTIINETGKMNANYSDLRFTDSNGATPLPYWCENCTRTTNATFWVKVPSIPTSGKTIYAYYGNPQANDAQNGTGTFVVWDDFSSDNRQWTEVDPGSNFAITNGRLEFTNLDQSSVQHSYVYKNIPAIGDFAIDYNWVISSWATDARAGVGLANSTGSMAQVTGGIYAGTGEGTEAWIIYTTTSHGATDYTPTASEIDSGSPNYVTFTRAGSTARFNIFSNPTRTTHKAGSPLTWTGAPTASYTVAYAYSDWAVTGTTSATGYIDNIRVRKYASPEPSATQGTEESLTTMAGGAQNWTWKVPTAGEFVRSGGAQDWNWKPFQQYLGRYRKLISISGSGSTLTDFQVNVTPYIYNETGLVGSWHFSESSGNATADSSGLGNTGYQYGSNRTTDGKFGNAMKFDGTDDYVEITDSSSLHASYGITIEAWVKINKFPASSAAIIEKMKTSAATNSWTVRLESGGDIRWQVSNGAVDIGLVSNPLRLGEWVHYAFVYDPSNTIMYIYVNGTQDKSYTYSGITGINVNDKNVRMGWEGGGNNYFNGTIDEVRIYNRTLSASEIQQQYQATKARLDYQDIRFTDSDGATLLPFWMESDGKFWVKVPSIPATTGTTIYAYYGNPQANDAQNATGTFIQSVAGQTAHFITSLDFPSSGGYVLEWQSQFWNELDFGFGATLTRDPPDSIKYQLYSDYSVCGQGGSPCLGSYVNGNTYKGRIIWPSQATRATYVVDGVGSGVRTSDNPAVSMGMYGWWQANTGTIYWMNVRKYASPEPLAVNGTDEDSPIPQNITVPVGNAMNWTWYPS